MTKDKTRAFFFFILKKINAKIGTPHPKIDNRHT
jgi:hypothetical protein